MKISLFFTLRRASFALLVFLSAPALPAKEQVASVLRTAESVKEGALETVAPGAYRNQAGLTSGYVLHLFPDGVSILEEFGDVVGSRILRQGDWRVDRDQCVISWRPWKASSANERAVILREIGLCERLNFLVGNSVSDKRCIYGVSEELDVLSTNKYLIRITEYVNWVGIRDALLKQANPTSQPRPGDDQRAK